MNYNNILAASALDAEQNEIVKSVWLEEKYSNMTAWEANSNCSDVPDDGYNECMRASNACGSDSKCDRVAKNYSKALSKGFKGSFNDFKNKSKENLATLGNVGINILDKLFGGSDDSSSSSYQTDSYGGNNSDKSSSKTGLIIGVSALALVGIGTAIYFAVRK
jgi:hypothetical protein